MSRSKPVVSEKYVSRCVFCNQGMPEDKRGIKEVVTTEKVSAYAKGLGRDTDATMRSYICGLKKPVDDCSILRIYRMASILS